MADGERGRGGFRRRRFYTNRERDKERHGRGRDRFYFDKKDHRTNKEEEKEIKHLVILTKPKPEGEKDTPAEPAIQPTILLKTREGDSRTVSPNPPSSPMTRQNEGMTTNPSYQIVTKSPAPPDLSRLLLSDTKMKRSVCLIEGSSAKDHVLSFLTDQTDYLIVGCLGPVSVGKSFLLSRLVNHHSKSRSMFDVQDPNKNSKPTTLCLDKIDIYVTEGRVIFLDSKAISPSVLVKLAKKDSDDQRLFENESELLSYQYVALLLSVCHIVCCVMDRTTEENLLKFLLTVEVLKPATTTRDLEGDQVIEYSPQLLLIHNKCEPEDYSWRNLKSLQELYRNTFQNSKMHIETGLGITNGQVLPTLNPEICQSEPMNLFMLPVLESKSELDNLDKYRGHLGYHKLVSKLRQQIFAAEPMPLTYNTLSEKNWYHYVVKIWENIKKSSNISDYSRPSQSWSIMKERNSYGKT